MSDLLDQIVPPHPGDAKKDEAVILIDNTSNQHLLENDILIYTVMKVTRQSNDGRIRVDECPSQAFFPRRFLLTKMKYKDFRFVYGLVMDEREVYKLVEQT